MKKLRNIAILLFAATTLSSCGYNNMVAKSETVESQWAQVENVYQRRADLIPNLVNTVKGYADFEKSTLTEVIEARAKATSINVNMDELNPQNIEKFQKAQSELSGALSRLMMTVERYPDLKANQNIIKLQAQLELTDHMIAVKRKKFNNAYREINTNIKQIPKLIYASRFDYEKKRYYEAQTRANKVPEVEF